MSCILSEYTLDLKKLHHVLSGGHQYNVICRYYTVKLCFNSDIWSQMAIWLNLYEFEFWPQWPHKLVGSQPRILPGPSHMAHTAHITLLSK